MSDVVVESPPVLSADVRLAAPEQFYPAMDLCLQVLADFSSAQNMTPPIGPLTDAFTKVQTAVSNLREVLIVCQDAVQRAHPEPLPIPAPTEEDEVPRPPENTLI